MQQTKTIAILATLALLGLAPVVSHADEPSSASIEPPAHRATIDYAVRAGIGVGLGSGDHGGIGTRAGVEGDWWWSHHVGVGARASRFANTDVFNASCEVYAFAPTVSLRTSPMRSRSYGVLGLGLGYARVLQSSTSGGLLGGKTTHRSSDAVYASVSAGWLFHHGPIELGPMLQLEATPQTQVATINFVVGLGL